MNNKEIFSNNLKNLLSKIGKSQTEMAKELNFPEMTVSNWTNAKTYPRIDKIEKMANYFGVSKADLVEEAPAEKTENKLTDREENLLKDYNSLNDLGKIEASKRVNELTEIPRYSILVETIAAHADNIDKEQLDLIKEDIEDMKKW